MDSYAELEINLVSLTADQCQVQMRYRPPNSQSEIRLESPASVPITALLDPGSLGPKFGDGKSYASALTDALFSNPQTRQVFLESITAAEVSGSVLRVRLWIDSSSSPLHDICWELLINPKDGTRLSAGERILFSRGLSTMAAAPATLKPPEDAVALVAVANPTDLSNFKLATIDVPAELARAQASLSGLGAVRVLPGSTDARVTLDNLFAALTPDVDILYLACHGTASSEDALIWLEGPDGKSHRVSAADFIARIRGLPAYPEMIVLISCQSAGGSSGSAWRALGPRLVNAGVPVVLAMQGNFSMQSEAAFTPRFFQSLREHGEADRALSYARTFIADRPDWWVPAIFSHLRDNRIFASGNPNALPALKLQPYEPETVYVASGPFWMGSDDQDAAPYERPRHSVHLPAFRMGKHAVTNRQFAEFTRQTKSIVQPEMGWSGQNPPAAILDQPAQGVSWYDAVEYCKWLGEKTRRTYRLPCEAEWEKAARGTDGRRYPWGSDWDPARSSDAAQSIYGCNYQVGNLREWTISLWGQNRIDPDPAYLYPWVDDQRNDISASKLIRRVIRGAGINDQPESPTCFARNSSAPDKPGPPGKRHGFRVLMEI